MHRLLTHKERMDKKTEKLIRIHNKPDWQEDDGDVFLCKKCGRYMPVDLKSRGKKGVCMLCRGELPNQTHSYKIGRRKRT